MPRAAVSAAATPRRSFGAGGVRPPSKPRARTTYARVGARTFYLPPPLHMTSHHTPRAAAVRAISTAALRSPPRAYKSEGRNYLPELFGTLVFSDAVQRQRMPRGVYDALRRTIDAGAVLDPEIADSVANAMKDWAIEHGATHFSHWF